MFTRSALRPTRPTTETNTAPLTWDAHCFLARRLLSLILEHDYRTPVMLETGIYDLNAYKDAFTSIQALETFNLDSEGQQCDFENCVIEVFLAWRASVFHQNSPLASELLFIINHADAVCSRPTEAIHAPAGSEDDCAD